MAHEGDAPLGRLYAGCSVQRANKRSSQTISFTRTSSTRLLNFDKITLSKFLTSLNIAQKVKKFKTLTSVKKNLRCLT